MVYVDGSRVQLPRIREAVALDRHCHRWRRCAAPRVQHLHSVVKYAPIEIRGVIIVRNSLAVLAHLICVAILLTACTTTYRESDFAEERLDDSTVEAPDCSLLADEPGCEVESPFDPRDEEL